MDLSSERAKKYSFFSYADLLNSIETLLENDGHVLERVGVDVEKLKRTLENYREAGKLWNSFYRGEHSVVSRLEEVYSRLLDRNESYSPAELREIATKLQQQC